MSRYFKAAISFIGCTMFWYMILGSVYMLIFTTNMVVKDDKFEKTNKIQ
ncbi:hypothetical protein [Clostridium akagii]|nr:hypothetical protein [Clostridium akagii]